MKNNIIPIDANYIEWLNKIKKKIRSAQIRTVLAANRTLIEFYYELGESITKNQLETNWGDGFLQQLSKDLKSEFPDMGGLSFTNLRYCRLFYKYFLICPQSGDKLENVDIQSNVIYPQLADKLGNVDILPNVICPQVVDKLEKVDIQSNIIYPQTGDKLEQQPNANILRDVVFNLPWGHIKVIISKIKDINIARFYFEQAIQNGWSRDTLELQIKSELHKRQGKSITNFSQILPETTSDLAQQALKDPYVFDFMAMTKPYNERDIENQLISHLSKFMLELGKGFAFVGQQYHLEIADNDYYIDLLFYNIPLKCYVVIELKNTKFIPEYAGKLNFYLSAVDTLLKKDDDNPTIGILLCRDKNNIEAEFSLRDVNKPIGVSEYVLLENLPKDLQGSLPTVQEIEDELKKSNL
jgi:predicted nuclease of restriction endonuclease-like (RecB) superfamily